MHPDGSIEPDGLAVEVWVAEDALDEGGELIRLTKARGERDALVKPLSHLLTCGSHCECDGTSKEK